jgi:hypothetical protein
MRNPTTAPKIRSLSPSLENRKSGDRTLDSNDVLCLLDVPQLHSKITRGRTEDVFCRWMEIDVHNALRVALQCLERLHDVQP